MRFAIQCRDVQALIYAGEDRALAWPERAAKNVHFLICKSCGQIQSNVLTLRQGLNRWRAYGADAQEAEVKPNNDSPPVQS